ncbi:hypothetical protein [Streptosporangium sp. NPDC002524]|uniref:hypothetical protein n=1 Tax=Streptosporangium sp. NPDC002524 TaxID=3154537 RepID=UPI0033218CA1
MTNPNAPVLNRPTASGCSADAPSPSTGQESNARPLLTPLPDPPERSPAVQRAEELVAVLDDVYGISADVHKLVSGNAIVSVHYGLLAYTDGERFWWTGPEHGDSGSPLLSSELTLPVVAEQLARHYRILRARPAASVLESELPLLADVILADHVVPR